MRPWRRPKFRVSALSPSEMATHIRFSRGARRFNTATRRQLRRAGLHEKPVGEWTTVDFVKLGALP